MKDVLPDGFLEPGDVEFPAPGGFSKETVVDLEKPDDWDRFSFDLDE